MLQGELKNEQLAIPLLAPTNIKSLYLYRGNSLDSIYKVQEGLLFSCYKTVSTLLQTYIPLLTSLLECHIYGRNFLFDAQELILRIYVQPDQ
jgi:hypothetical protein